MVDRIPSKTIENPQVIGEHIKKRRAELHLKQSEFARLIGVCEDTICGWENGRSQPHIQQYPKLIDVLGYNPFAPMNTCSFGAKIKSYRAAHGLSQNNLADIFGVDETTIRSWERNWHSPSARKRKNIEDIINQKEPSH